MKNKRESKFLSVMTSILTALAVVAGAIAVPILCRPFYYAHITPLQMRLRVGLTEAQVRETYNEVMDYCLDLTEDFRLSHLAWSSNGAEHFADVQRLFLLDLKVLIAALIGLVILWAAARCRNIQPASIKGHSPGFWAASGLATAFVTLGLLASSNFDAAFTAFHAVFFPGKENWIFDEAVDPVIKMLPQVFFRNCAILVLALLLTACTVLILADCYRRKRNKNIQK